MKSKLIATVAASLLAGTMFAAAQQSGAPGNEKDRTGQPADSSTNSAQPNRPATQGQGGPVVTPRAGSPSGPAMNDPLPGEPSRGAAPRQGEGAGTDAIPNRK